MAGLTIKVPTRSRIHRSQLEALLIFYLVSGKRTHEIKILSYMLRNHTAGVYVTKRGFQLDMAEALGISVHVVKQSLKRMSKKGLIKYLDNNQGNNLGCYGFHPAAEAITSDHSELTFEFMNKKQTDVEN